MYLYHTATKDSIFFKVEIVPKKSILTYMHSDSNFFKIASSSLIEEQAVNFVFSRSTMCI